MQSPNRLVRFIGDAWNGMKDLKQVSDPLHLPIIKCSPENEVPTLRTPPLEIVALPCRVNRSGKVILGTLPNPYFILEINFPVIPHL